MLAGTAVDSAGGVQGGRRSGVCWCCGTAATHAAFHSATHSTAERQSRYKSNIDNMAATRLNHAGNIRADGHLKIFSAAS